MQPTPSARRDTVPPLLTGQREDLSDFRFTLRENDCLRQPPTHRPGLGFEAIDHLRFGQPFGQKPCQGIQTATPADSDGSGRTLPGFIRPCGSKTALMRRMASNSSGPCTRLM